MEKPKRIEFWKDKEKGQVDPLLFSKTADEWAQKFIGVRQKSNKLNSPSQLRKFYDEVVTLNTTVQAKKQDFDHVLPLVHMLVAKAAYAKGRGHVSDDFMTFISTSVDKIQDGADLNIFATFFEAIIGFYKYYNPDSSKA